MTLHKDITGWSTPKSGWFAAKVGKALYSQQKQDLKLNMAQIMRSLLQKLKRVEKITRPFRYDWSQIPYACTVEVTNRFKGLDLMEILKNYGKRFVTLYRTRWSKPSLRKRNVKRLSEEALQIAEQRREAKRKREKERYTHLNAEFQRIARRDMKAFSDQCKEIEENNRVVKIRDCSNKGY